MVSLELQKQTLEALAILPPIDYLLRLETEDQFHHWKDLKDGYSWLEQAFKNYFSGKAANIKGLSPQKLEFYGLYRDYYLAWYGIVQWGWDSIVDYFDDRGVNLADELDISTPGEAFLSIINADCEATMQSCLLPLHRWSPHKTREINSLRCKVEQDSKLKQTGKQAQARKKKLQNLEVATTSWSDDFTFLRRILIAICRMHQEKDATLKRRLKDFDKITAALNANFRAQLHPNKYVSGFEWVGGKKKVLSRYGGVAT